MKPHAYLLRRLSELLLSTAWPHWMSGQAILLCHRPEPSGRVVHEEVDGLDIRGQHG